MTGFKLGRAGANALHIVEGYRRSEICVVDRNITLGRNTYRAPIKTSATIIETLAEALAALVEGERPCKRCVTTATVRIARIAAATAV